VKDENACVCEMACGCVVFVKNRLKGTEAGALESRAGRAREQAPPHLVTDLWEVEESAVF
jgi:hypothetical protein